MVKRPKTTDPVFEKLAHAKMAEAIERHEPFVLVAEPTAKCAGSCAYCYASSTEFIDIHWEADRAFKLLDECVDLGIGYVMWVGGDPIEHPDFFALTDYAMEKGLEQNIMLSGLVSKDMARRIKKIQEKQPGLCVGIHIDSIAPEVYSRVHTDPSTLPRKMQGYRNLLDTGFPSQQLYGLIHFCKPIVETIEETVDWFVDKMDAPWVCFSCFKPGGFGGQHLDWEYSPSDLKRANEYRAKKCGEHWQLIGPTEAGRLSCDTEIFVYPDGNVGPCSNVRHGEFIAGNIYKESFVDIVRKHKDMLLFNFEVKGKCGHCDYNDYCRGCRGAAYWATGDITEADPKCYRNPDNTREYVYGKIKI